MFFTRAPLLTHHTSGILLWIRGSCPGLAARFYRYRHGPVSLPAADDSFHSRKSQLRRRSDCPRPPGTNVSVGLDLCRYGSAAWPSLRDLLLQDSLSRLCSAVNRRLALRFALLTFNF